MNTTGSELLKTGAKRMLRRAGHALHCSEYLHKYCFGYHLAELFRRLDIRCVLDIGAHRGGYCRFLRNEVGYRGLVVSFEPVRQHAAALRAQARGDPAWIVHDFALGAAPGQRQINVMRQGVFSSFLQPDHSHVADFAATNEIDHQELVRVETVDAIMDDLRAKHRMDATHLKIDTQGFDLEVIQGARQSLPLMASLQTEVSVRPLYQGMPDFPASYATLVSLGFELTGLYPACRDSALRLVEMDCVMVNARAAERR